MRVRRICAEEEDFKAGLSKLKKDFETRGYKESILGEHFAKVSNIDRKRLLICNEKKGDNKIKFITKYNRGLHNIRNVFESNWHVLQTNEKLTETFEDKPILAFRQQKPERYFRRNSKHHGTKVSTITENTKRNEINTL